MENGLHVALNGANIPTFKLLKNGGADGTVALRFEPRIALFSRLRHLRSPGIITPPVAAPLAAVSVMPASPSSAPEPSFEEAMERLEEIVSAWRVSVCRWEMVQSYAEGAQLLKVCRQRIEVARQRVELITADPGRHRQGCSVHL